MKMKKKSIKSLNILNRNIYINFYSNYMIYNYLNNYNLKFFFYYLMKKSYYLKNKKKILVFNKLSIYKKSITLNNSFYFKNTNFKLTNFKDKFFNANFNKFTKVYNFINKKILYFNTNNSLSNKSNSSLIISQNHRFINLDNKVIIDINLLYKEIFFIIFILNLLKLFEFYKLLISLTYLNIKI